MSSCSPFDDINIDTNDIIIKYEYLGIDNDYDTEDEYPINTVFKYQIKVINNTDYKLENVQKIVYGIDSQEVPTTGCLQENYVDIEEDNFTYSFPTRLFFDNSMTEDEVFELLKSKENDIVSFNVFGKRYECTGTWVDMR